MQRGSHKIGKLVAKLLDLCTMQWWMVVVVGEGWGRGGGGGLKRFSSTCCTHCRNIEIHNDYIAVSRRRIQFNVS